MFKKRFGDQIVDTYSVTMIIQPIKNVYHLHLNCCSFVLICTKFEFQFEEMGTIKRGSGVACKDGNKNWRMLGEEML